MGAIVQLRSARRPAGTPARIQVYATLREGIVRGEFAPGAQLSENTLALEFDVSRTPVREALARLRDDRLVEVLPQRGTFVTRIDPRAVDDAQFIRETLECAAVRRASELAVEADIARLEENLQGQARAEAGGDAEAFNVLDNAFHRSLCDLSGHPAVWAVTERAKAHLNRVRRLSLAVPDYVAEMIDEHRSVLVAVAAGDPDGAEAALRHHLRMVLREIPLLRRKHPHYFAES